FFVGLAVPYILWGFLADASSATRLSRARAQAPAAPQNVMVTDRNLHTLRIEVRDDATKEVIPDAVTAITPAGMDAAVATSILGTYALPPGDYRLTISARGYVTAKGDLKLSESLTIKMYLMRASWWQQFLGGAATVIFPATGTKSNIDERR